MDLFLSFKNFFITVAAVSQFTMRFFKEILRAPFEIKETIHQCYEIGYKSILLVGTTAFIMGLVITLQSRPTLVEFGAGSWLPAMVGVSIVREIGPVVTALMCAGKVGSNIGAELGSMRVTEQLDAMEVSGTNPFKYVVVTRIVATTFMRPLLVIFADFISLTGAFVATNMEGHTSFQLFFDQVFKKLDFLDLIPSVAKSIFFGFAIGLISSYQGYHSSKGTEGVGRSANAAVVISSLFVFLIDLIVVQITNFFY